MILFPFPKGFLWGTGSASFQIEGGAFEGGKGLTIWDQACVEHISKFSKQATPSVAADFYHHYPKDIEEMKKLGLTSFRFSIAWARIFPAGRGALNREGVAFYNAIIDCLLENGIAPFVDLYHWDLPQALQDEGGFENPSLIPDFVAYAKTCFEQFGDRVKFWSTFNEPHVVAMDGYGHKGFPPYKGELRSGFAAAHHILLMHGKTVRLYKDLGLAGKIGAVNAFVPVYPNTLSAEDKGAAVRQQDMICNWWLGPMLKGEYPESVLREDAIRQVMPDNFATELAGTHSRMDFAGINYYCPAKTAYCPDSRLRAKVVEVFTAQTDYGFDVYPPGLYDSLQYLRSEYGNPEIYLTENGIGNARLPSLAEELADRNRIEYVREHLRELSRAIQAGCNVRGYYHWSHFDDFSGHRGYDFNFGLLHVDRDTLKRTPRESWRYYQSCISANAVD